MDVKGRDVDSFVKEAGAAQGSGADAGRLLGRVGRRLREPAARARLALIVPLTIGLIFLLLYTAFNSLRHATIIIANVPFAIIGGIVGLFVTGQYLSVPSAIGFIAVFGVAMLNGIVLVSFLNDQRRHGLSVREAVRQGAALRLRPVLMTASVAILGLIPMLLSTGVGAETQRPLATVVVGGLITSTALTLLLLPLIYEWAELRAERRKQPQPVPAIEGATHEGNQGLRPRQPHCRRHRRAEGLDRVGAIRITTNTTWRSTL
jgi:cobalt-zinc-cadmium resistance protein CzcA